MENLTEILILGVPISAVSPIVVEQIKKQGLTDQWTAPASMLVCLVLVILASVATGTAALTAQAISLYLLQGILYGLAGNGIYSQSKMFSEQLL